MKQIGIMTFIIFIFPMISVAQSPVGSFNTDAATETCKDKWTKRGVLDSGMFDYCMEDRSDGYSEANILYNKYKTVDPVELIDDVVLFARGKWLTRKKYDFGMVAYEIKQQGEAFLNIAYDLKEGKFSQTALSTCKEKWLKTSKPQWDMVEYCLND
jgi:hypothetical protein